MNLNCLNIWLVIFMTLTLFFLAITKMSLIFEYVFFLYTFCCRIMEKSHQLLMRMILIYLIVSVHG